jgi:hypothetical protein
MDYFFKNIQSILAASMRSADSLIRLQNFNLKILRHFNFFLTAVITFVASLRGREPQCFRLRTKNDAETTD